MTLEVASAGVRNGVAVITFTDGHKASFCPNTCGWGEPTTLERIMLAKGGHEVAVFNSQHQYPVNYRPFGIVDLARGYTTQRATAYWVAAYDYAVSAYKLAFTQDPPRSGPVEVWRILYKGRHDIEELRANRWAAS